MSFRPEQWYPWASKSQRVLSHHIHSEKGRTTKTLGIIFLVVGILMSMYSGFNYVTKENVVIVRECGTIGSILI